MYIHIPFLVLVELLLKNNSVVDMFFRMTNPEGCVCPCG